MLTDPVEQKLQTAHHITVFLLTFFFSQRGKYVLLLYIK